MQNAILKKQTTADVKSLQQLNFEYVRAVEEANTEWFDRHLASDFMNSNPDCTLVDRAEFLKQIARGAGVTDLTASDVRIRVIGDLGIIHARTAYMMSGGSAGAGRYTDIWSRQGGRWVCVAAQVNRG